MANTKIAWADKVWNPVVGCSKVSPGCQNCYAERMAKRLANIWYAKGHEANAERYGEIVNYLGNWMGRVSLFPERLNEPLGWRKPRRIFVNSMGDLFHENVPTGFVSDVFRIMERCPQHTFLILTKRPERMKQLLNGVVTGRETEHRKHIWLGVSAENQQAFDERTELLSQIPAAVRFVSIEPMLGEIKMGRLVFFREGFSPPQFQEEMIGRKRIDWIIAGCESGPGRRPANLDWFRSLRDQCVAAGVPFFLKQAVINGKLVEMPELDGQVWAQYPGEAI